MKQVNQIFMEGESLSLNELNPKLWPGNNKN